MRILFLTQFWQPEQFFKGLRFARDFADKGYDVQVLTGFPHYPTGKILSPYRLKLFQREIMDGIKVNRVFLYPSHDRSTFKRIATYLTFMFSTMILGPFIVRKVDIVYVYNLVTLWPFAAFMKRVYGAKIVYDLQDLWPESILSSGMMKPNLIMRWLDRLCIYVYSGADKVAVQSPGFKKYLVDHGVPEGKIEIIFNWTNESDYPPLEMATQDKEDCRPLHILYAGALGPVQGLESVVESAAICQERKISVFYRLIGYGTRAEGLRRLVREKELINCEVLPGLPLKDMGRHFSWADILLVHLKDVPIFRITIPSKIQASLYLGKPILLAIRGDAAKIIEEAKAGFVCSPGNPQEIAKLAKHFASMTSEERQAMGENGRFYYNRCMAQSIGMDAFESLFQSAIDES